MFKPNSASKLPIGQLTLLVFTVGVGGLLIVSAVKENLGISFLLLCLLSVAGLLLCQHTQKALDDSSLKVLGYYWLIKLLLTFFLLYASWIPILNTESQYDPVRYYYQAGDLARNNFDFGLIHINYIGVLYYYGVIFYLIGHNPIIPALLNKVGFSVVSQKAN